MTGTATVAAALPGTAPPAPSLEPGPGAPATPALTSGGTGGQADGTPAAEEDTSAAPGDPVFPVTVSVVDFAFAPSTVQVPVGGAVVWRLDGSAPHTATSLDGGFDSGILQPGGEFTHRFDERGTFDYVCALHPQMKGSVEVIGTAFTPAGGPSAGGDEGRAQPISSTGRRAGLLAGLMGGGGILAGAGAFLFGSSRMMAAGRTA